MPTRVKVCETGSTCENSSLDPASLARRPGLRPSSASPLPYSLPTYLRPLQASPLPSVYRSTPRCSLSNPLNSGCHTLYIISARVQRRSRSSMGMPAASS